MTAIVTPDLPSAAFWSVAADESEHVSYERCLDWLLDLRQSTDDPQLLALVDDVLGDVRALGSVSGDSELESLLLGALASVEVAFELAG